MKQLNSLLDIKSKLHWKNEYINQINENLQRKKQDKEKVLKQEQEYIQLLNKETEQIKEEQLKRKSEQMKKLSHEYDKEESKIRLKRLKEEYDRKRQENTSLDTNNQDRVRDYKENQNELIKLNQIRSEYYLKFKNENTSTNENKIEKLQDEYYNKRSVNQCIGSIDLKSNNNSKSKLYNDLLLKTKQKETENQDNTKNNNRNNINETDKFNYDKYKVDTLGDLNNQNNNQIETIPIDNKKDEYIDQNHIRNSNIITFEQANYNSYIKNQALNKSVYEYNKEQANTKLLNKYSISEIRRQAELRSIELNNINKEKEEILKEKLSNQNSYKRILDSQTSCTNEMKKENNINCNCFKFYVGNKNYDLGVTMIENNPILNPVNSYSFAKYYIKKHNL